MFREAGQRAADALEIEIVELAGHIHASTCRWLGLVAQYDRSRAWAASGCKSCAHWISWRCSIAPGPAREHIRVARRLEELPLIRASFARGELSYSKVRALTRVEKVADEEALLGYARNATAHQLERIVRGYRQVVVRESAGSDPAARRLDHWEEDDGTVVIKATLPPEEAALVLAAIEAAQERLRAAAHEEGLNDGSLPLHASPESVPAGTPKPSRADGLVHLADSFLARARSGDLGVRSGGDRWQVVVHVDADALAGEDPGARAELDDGAPIPAETARRLACDASLVRIVERDGRPLSVGRKTRSVPPALRRALRSRDRTCRFPGCTTRHHLDAHHIEHWARGGRTDLGNLVHLCHHHHKLLHEGGFTMSATSSGGLEFRRPDGQPLSPSPARTRGDVDCLREGNRDRGIVVTDKTCVPLSYDPLHLGWAVEGMLRMAPPRCSEPPGI